MQKDISLSDIIDLSKKRGRNTPFFVTPCNGSEAFLKVTKDHILYNIRNLKQIVFEVTDACNLECTYCGLGRMYEGNDDRCSKNLSFGRCKQIVDFLADIWKKFPPVSFNQTCAVSFYGGEPLLNMSLIKRIISYLEQLPDNNRKFRYSMTTNAVLLDKHMDYLVQKKFALLVSLDGDESGHSYRVDHAGNSSFNKVFANLKNLQQSHLDYFKMFVNFNAVLHDRNSVESISRFIQDNFEKKPLISEMATDSLKESEQETYNKMFRSKVKSANDITNKSFLESILDNSPAFSSLVSFIDAESGNVFDNYNELIGSREKDFVNRTGTCLPFAKKMFITVTGKILPCERISQKYAMGEVSDKKVTFDYNQIVEEYNKLTGKYVDQCKICHYRKRCKKCVFTSMTINGTNTECENFGNKESFDKFTENQKRFLVENPKLYKKIMRHSIIRR